MKTIRKHLALLAAMLHSIPVLTQATVISSGTATIEGTFTFDFDAGIMPLSASDTTADVFWEQFTSATRGLQPDNGGTLVNLGAVNFNTITLAAAAIAGVSDGRN